MRHLHERERGLRRLGYTVTTAYPWSRAVAARRTAISRLAMRSVFFMRIRPLLNA